MAMRSQSNYSPQWGAWTRHLMTVLLIVGAIFGLSLLGSVVQMLILAALLTFVLFVPARSLTRRLRLPWALSVILIYFFLTFVIVFGILILLPAAVDVVQNISNGLIDSLSGLEDNLQPYLQEGRNTVEVLGVQVDIQFILDPIRQALGAMSQINQPPDTIGDVVDASGSVTITSGELRSLINSLLSLVGTLTETLSVAVTSIAGLVTGALLAILISFFLLLDVPSMSRSITRWIPDPYNREYALLVSKIVRVWNGFFKGQVIIGVMIGILTFIQLQMMGISNAPLLAALTGMISLIPTIGGFLALIPLGLVPLLNGSTVFIGMPYGLVALFVIVVNLIISQIIWTVIAPKILGDVLDLPLVLIIIGVFIGAAVGGLLGAFLVAPIMGTIRIMMLYVINKIGMHDPYPGESAPFMLGEARFLHPHLDAVTEERTEPTAITQS